MPIRPKLDFRAPSRPSDGLDTGGGGSSSNATEWVEMSLDPTHASWKFLKNGHGNNADCTLSKSGPLMVASMPTTRSYNLGGTTNNGMSLISAAHITPWANFSGGGPPEGVPAQQVQPEAQVIKIEVQFDDTNGAWNAPGSGAGNGMICVAGFVSYASDQGGNPGYSGWIYRGAQVRKTRGNVPADYAAVNLYRTGFKSYFGWADAQPPVNWSNQQNATAASHNAIVYELGVPLRKSGNTGVNQSPCGSYSTTDPFGAMGMSGYGNVDATTVTSNVSTNCNFFHLWLYFGSHTSGGGTCKIKRIRWCVQPVPSRVAT